MKPIQYLLLALFLLHATAFAGSLDNSGSPTAGSSMPSTTAIYNRLDSGAEISIPGAFQEPAAGPAPSGRTLAEIATKLPAADNSNGAALTDVLSGKTFWGLRTDGTWGLKTGTLAMAASQVPLNVSSLTAAVSTNITVTAGFPASQAGKTATFSSTGGTLAATSVTIAGDGTATTSFSSGSTGTFNIYAVEGLYAGGAVVSITETPAATYSISGTISLNGTGQSGLFVVLTGVVTNAAITAADGTYSFAGLPNGSYTVTPWPGSYNFLGTSKAVTINNANATEVDFYNRWLNNFNGTVTDRSTGLVWLKDANCLNSPTNWVTAQTWAAGLKHGDCGLSDGSAAGDWRLPTKEELIGFTTGTEQVRSDTPRLFENVKVYYYWSSSTVAEDAGLAWLVYMLDGNVTNGNKNLFLFYVLPVRGGQ